MLVLLKESQSQFQYVYRKLILYHACIVVKLSFHLQLGRDSGLNRTDLYSNDRRGCNQVLFLHHRLILCYVYIDLACNESQFQLFGVVSVLAGGRFLYFYYFPIEHISLSIFEIGLIKWFWIFTLLQLQPIFVSYIVKYH